MCKRVQIAGKNSLLRCLSIGLLAGVSAGCSADIERFSDPILTGSTANQRQIVGSNQQAPVSLPPRSASVPVTYDPAPYDVSSPQTPRVTASAPKWSAPRSTNRLTTANIRTPQSQSYPRPPAYEPPKIVAAPLPAPQPVQKVVLQTIPRSVAAPGGAPVRASVPLVTGNIQQPIQPESVTASYNPPRPRNLPLPPVQPVEVTRPAVDPAVQANPNGGWTRAGGTYVPLKQGDTIYTMSRRYGVPVSAVLKANNLVDASQAKVGQQIIIPTYVHSASAPVSSPDNELAVISRNTNVQRDWQNVPAPKVHPNRSARQYNLVPQRTAGLSLPVTEPSYNARQQAVQQPVRLISASSASRSLPQVVSAPTPSPRRQPRLVAQNNQLLAQPAVLVTGSINRESYPQGTTQTASLIPAPIRRPDYVTRNRANAKKPVITTAQARTSATVQTASLSTNTVPASVQQRLVSQEPAKVQQTADKARSFRWPVNGRVISGFGDKLDGQLNDGINLSVPMNTPVKAVEDGQVIYAGNELKGYGNLVLLRHADGWVSAYAHNAELSVNRGETIRRGQVVARSGQSGSVSSPQLHFELRKGSKPVNPIPHLGGS